MENSIAPHPKGGTKRSTNLQKPKKISLLKDLAKNRFSYMLALPAVLYVFIFSYASYPYLAIAFQQFSYKKGLFNSEWVGFRNFEFFFKSSDAAVVMINTLKLNLMFMIGGTIFAVALAILFNEIRHKFFIKLTQSMMIFPSFLSWIIVSYLMYILFSTNTGMVNHLIEWFGGQPTNWYSKAEDWPMLLTGMKIWKDAGMSSIIYLAAITGIDQTYYESAEIDGASRWRKIQSITLPLLGPTIAILTLLNLGRIFYGDFGMIYAIIGDNGVLYPTTDVIDTYLFRALRQVGDPSNAAAIGLFQSIVGFVLVLTANWITRKVYKEGTLI